MANKKGVGKYDIISKGALDTWEEFISLAQMAHEQLLAIVKEGPKANKALAGAGEVESFSEAVKDVVSNLQALLKVQKDLDQINKKLNGGDEKAAEAKRKQAEATKRATAAAKKRAATMKYNSEMAKLQAQMDDKLSSKVDKLRIKNKMLELQMKRLGTVNKKNLGEYKRLYSQYKLNERALRKLSDSGKKHYNGIGAIGRGLKNLIISYVGVRAAWNALVKVFEDTKTLDSLNFAIKNVIKSQTEQAETMEYVRGISNAYGTDLIDTTRSYIKFRAAVGATNLTVQEGRQIFDSFAKAAAVLGLRADEVNGVFLALEQMISKGKVTTEELRRQLGERIPGAFNIMANAIGVTTRKLDEMLKKGEIVSEEALPKMAAELEKTFGIEQVTKVNTLVAAQERLRTTWLSFIQELQASDKFLSKLDAINQAFRLILQTFGYLTDNEDTGFAKASIFVNNIADKSRDAADEARRLKIEYENIKEELTGVQQQVTDIQAAIVKDYGSALSEEEIVGRMMPKEKVVWEHYKSLMKQSEVFKDAINSIWQRQYTEQLNMAEKSDEELLEIQENYYDQVTYLLEKYTDVKAAQLDKDIYLRKDNAKKLDKVLTQDELKPFLKYYASIDEMRKRNAEEELDGTDNEWNEKLAIFKAQQAAQLAAYKEHLEAMKLAAYQGALERGATEEQAEDYANGLAMDQATDLFNFRINQNKDLLAFVKGHAKDEANAVKEGAELQSKYVEESVKFQMDEEERKHKQFMDDQEAEAKAVRDRVDEQILAIERWMNAQIQGMAKKNVDQSATFKYGYQFDDQADQARKDELGFLIAGYEQILQIEELTTDERASFEMKLHNLKMSLWDEEQQQQQQDAEERVAREREVTNMIGEYSQILFDTVRGFQDARMEQLEWDYERQMNLAGENIDQQIAVENKYTREKRKLQRRQAVIDKATTIFNIILDTWQGVMAALSNPVTIPLVPYIKLQGAIATAAAAAVPLPKYKEGGHHDEGYALFSEEGPELFIPDYGKPFLTPQEETIAHMPSGTFIPFDETQRILAQSAMNNFVNEVADIDLKPTNAILNKIANKSEIIYQNGYKIINKNGIFGRYVTRK